MCVGFETNFLHPHLNLTLAVPLENIALRETTLLFFLEKLFSSF